MTDGTVDGDRDAGDGVRLRLEVPEMDCPSCAGKVENALDGVDGVTGTEFSPATGVVTLTAASSEGREAAVEAVEAAGYEVTNASEAGSERAVPAAAEPVWQTTRARKTAASGVLLLAGLLLRFLPLGLDVAVARPFGHPLFAADGLLLVAVAVGGEVIVRSGYYSARNLSLDIDFLMTVAILGATAVSLFTPERLLIEAASLAVLFNVAELLERHAVDRARNSLTELLELAPERALVRRDGELTEVPAGEVAVGETVVVEPGEKVPLDGDVIEGESAVNEAPITGESVPVDKTVGDEVYAGSINESGYLEFEVTAGAEDTTLSRVIDLVEGAQERKTDREQFVDRFASYYTPIVVAAAILTATIPPLVLGWPGIEWLVNGITFLVIACPCAFVISTPVTVVSGVTSAARNGVLVKGGDHLEAMGEVDAVAVDKTGTLTTGDLGVTDVVPLNGNDEAGVLRCAWGLEARSEHPIAAAIVGHASAEGVADGDREVADFESLTGQGVRAELGGATHYAGKPALFEDLGFDLGHVHFTTDAGELPADARDQCARAGCLDLVEDTIPRLQSEGKTVILVGTDEEVEGLIAVSDTIRPNAARTVAALREQGLTTVMLTGDNEGTARAVAEEVGVDDFRAGLLPADKVSAVESLQAEYGEVAMVGDGINDAPALATADVGVAMGAAGSDTAIETADVALLGDDLSRLPYLSKLASRANGVIRQNIWGSLGVKAVLALGIPFGLVGVIHAVLIGDVGMTSAITGNAMRLARLEPEDL
ncbi:heavy metal translocating P-type ATPase [Halorientalis regularis]|uniref:Cd2+/Zn2+-exporting ATPase n=1 Tax=Halorientalis regularis TaxID=660518 RepID=A0A1G7J0U7_9EURY|nr:cation-translocating P-type ATPase [Halorientalis regularis]SDF18577.1 Cd2+/Zn2+-exporting ATPase [Halorientalis regularis]